MRDVRRCVVLVLLGVAIAQAAWILAVPPFRGSDEFDHYHRAAGVATGQWRLEVPAWQGRGLLVWVPAENVAAAQPQCDRLAYPGRDNCFAVGQRDGQARIATAAGGYNPAFYAFVGLAGRAWTAHAALYAMRAAAALLCLACIGAGVAALRSWHRGGWAMVGLLAALSPTFLYTSVLPAPNGLEMAAALPVWLALLGVQGDPDTARRDRALLLVACAATPLLVVPRTLGPLWLLAIGLTTMVWHGPGTFGRILRARWREVALFAAVAAAAAAANIGWVLSAGGYAGESPLTGGQEEIGPSVAFTFHTWALQMLAAFPLRDEPSALWVYPLGLLLVGGLVGAGLWRARGCELAALVTCLVLVFAIPMALTLLTLQDRGGEFQGRYALPYAAGLLPMAGLVLDRSGFAPVEGPRLMLLAVVAATADQVGSVGNVVTEELQQVVSSEDAGWVHPDPWVLLVVTAASGIAWLAVLRDRRTAP